MSPTLNGSLWCNALNTCSVVIEIQNGLTYEPIVHVRSELTTAGVHACSLSLCRSVRYFPQGFSRVCEWVHHHHSCSHICGYPSHNATCCDHHCMRLFEACTKKARREELQWQKNWVVISNFQVLCYIEGAFLCHSSLINELLGYSNCMYMLFMFIIVWWSNCW